MVFTRLTWVLSNAAWASFELGTLGVRNDLAKEMHTLVVFHTDAIKQWDSCCLIPQGIYVPYSHWSQWEPGTYERTGLSLPAAVGYAKKVEGIWWWWLQNNFPYPASLKLPRGFLRLCSVTERICSCFAFPDRDHEKQRTAVVHSETSSFPSVQAGKSPPMCLSESVFGCLRPGRSKPFSAGDKQAAVGHRLISWTYNQAQPWAAKSNFWI